jgi:hypothetical protein
MKGQCPEQNLEKPVGARYFPGGFFDDPEQAVAPAIAGYPTHYYN